MSASVILGVEIKNSMFLKQVRQCNHAATDKPFCGECGKPTKLDVTDVQELDKLCIDVFSESSYTTFVNTKYEVDGILGIVICSTIESSTKRGSIVEIPSVDVETVERLKRSLTEVAAVFDPIPFRDSDIKTFLIEQYD